MNKNASPKERRLKSTRPERPRSKKQSLQPAVLQQGPQHDWLWAHDDEYALRYRLARAAQATWEQLPIAERCQRLAPLLHDLRRDMHDIAQLISEENGKPRVEALTHEVGACMGNLRYLLSAAPRILAAGSINVPWMPHRTATLHRKPVGLVLIISPWNFPLSIALGQVMAALLAGNAVILKPSEVTPRCGQLIENRVERLNLPANLFTVLQGDGTVGAELIHRRPDKIFFTGSVATGRKVMASAAKHPIPVCLELGGVDAMVVLDDADIELASSAAAWGANFNGGQVCASVERLLLHRSIAELFVTRLQQKLEDLQAGQDLGHITLPRQKDIYDAHIQDARDRGLVVFGGDYLDDKTMRPGLVWGDGIEESRIYQEESFGPLTAITTFRDDRQAVAKHNAIAFGLSASVFSRSSQRAESVAKALRAGLVSINDVAATLHAFGEIPWGGVGHSGFGRSHGEDGLLEFTRNHLVERSRRGMPEFKRPWWFPYDIWQQQMMTEFTRLLGSQGVSEHVRSGARVVRAAAKLLRHSPRA